MGWNATGAAADFPSATPTVQIGVTLPPTDPLTFRLDPEAGVVYVAGSYTYTSSLRGMTIPEAFRPASTKQVLGVQTTSTSLGGGAANEPIRLQVQADGSVSGGTSLASYVVNGLYLLGV